MSSAGEICENQELSNDSDTLKNKSFKHKCAHCPFQTARKRSLIAHQNTHQKDANAFSCPKDWCYYRTIVKGHLQSHLESHESDRVKEIPCPLCSKKFYTDRLMQFHLKAHTNERKLQCEVCGYRAQNRTYLNIHRQRQHSLKPLDFKVARAKLRKCETCGYKTWVLPDFRRHLVAHQDEKPFKCSYPGCNFRTKRKDSLMTHERGHDKEKAFRCKYPGCTYQTGYKCNLGIHAETHNTEKSYVCSFPGCKYRSKVQHDLKGHERTIHYPNRDRRFQCGLCENAFLKLSNLQSHIRSHTKEKYFKCLMCSYSSTKKLSLHIHILNKHEEALAEDGTILEQHGIKDREETRPKKFPCTFLSCDFKSWFQEHVTRHMQAVHSELRPFHCPFKGCGLKFKTEQYFKKHKRTHDASRVRKYKCQLCKDRYFFTSRDVKSHILHVHKDDNPYKCRFCRFFSSKKKEVLNHMESSHSVELKTQSRLPVVLIQRIQFLHL